MIENKELEIAKRTIIDEVERFGIKVEKIIFFESKRVLPLETY